jgi:hypothetical protein
MRRRKVIFTGVGLIGAFACGARSQSTHDELPELLTSKPAKKVTPLNSSRIVTAAEYLQQLTAPKFKRGHTLPPLSRFGWSLPFETRVEFADRWGYALEWGNYASQQSVAAALADPKSIEARIMALAAAQPKKYQLSVLLSRDLPNTPDTIWLQTERGELVDGKNTWSPEAPKVALVEAARLRAEPLRQIRKIAPVAIVLNGGEYGLTVEGGIAQSANKDPKVLAAKGNRDWFDYLSERKAYQESFITKAVRQATPDRRIYVYYPADSNPHRDRYWAWKEWCYDYKYMRKITDYPSSSTYFKEFNTGWTGNMDLLSQVLNSIGQQIKFGNPLSYNWVCSGWERGDNPQLFGEIDRYLGFLKCYYTAGAIGGIAGYFSNPKGGFDATFPADRPPNWLQQMIALARVHGLFTHLEGYLRQGDLLPGPAQHIWSKDTPAYEFPTADPNTRVLARKHRQKSAWLVTAWAAAGDPRKVKATLPQLGEVELLARPIGSVYTVELVANKPKYRWVDRNSQSIFS